MKSEFLVECPHCGKHFRLGEINERKVLEILRTGTKTFGELKEELSVSSRTVNRALKSLMKQSRVQQKKEKSFPRRTFYSLSQGTKE